MPNSYDPGHEGASFVAGDVVRPNGGIQFEATYFELKKKKTLRFPYGLVVHPPPSKIIDNKVVYINPIIELHALNTIVEENERGEENDQEQRTRRYYEVITMEPPLRFLAKDLIIEEDFHHEGIPNAEGGRRRSHRNHKRRSTHRNRRRTANHRRTSKNRRR